jgi:uncharacterized membrane protein YcaP (DUF421 family)
MYFFDSWDSLLRTGLAGVIAYGVLVLLLRASGKRTLAKLNAFDLVVTVALGSTLASVITSSELPLANGLLALALLVGLQFVVAWLGVRLHWVSRLVKSEPTLLVYDGRMLDTALRRSRLNREEVLATVRSAGKGDLASVQAVVLETDGSLSVIARSGEPAADSTLSDVARAPD